MLQLFALVSPLFFQVVMDKVLVHRGITMLDVLVLGLMIVVLFESVLNGLRSHVFRQYARRHLFTGSEAMSLSTRGRACSRAANDAQGRR